VTARRLLFLTAGMLSLAMGEGSATAGRRASLVCRNTIARNVREFVHTSLGIIEACHRRTSRTRSHRDCNSLASSPDFVIAHARADAIIGAECAKAIEVFANYPRVRQATDLGGVLLPTLERTLETNASALLGPSGAAASTSARRRSGCRRAIGKATTTIVNRVVARAVRCQHAHDRKATSFGPIDDQCLQVDAGRLAAAARSSVARACDGLSGAEVGSCTSLPNCVIAQSILTGRAVADDIYGAPPEVRGLRCGNGVLDLGEFCDDGNRDDHDACTNECVPARCGDGIVETGVEECDDGNNVETDACTHLCKLARCGDGIVETGLEECDDGPNMPNADCADCHRPAVACTDQGILATASLIGQPGTPSDLGGVEVDISYPPPLDIPGSGGDASVRARVTDVSGTGGFAGVNDSDSNGDGIDDTLKYPYAVAGGAIAIGPLVQVRFDCPAGTMLLPAALPCNVTDASDSSGNSLGHCSGDGSPCRHDADCQAGQTCNTESYPRCTITLAAPRGP
jgi:cysteine-rich repeat protein